jgi:pilus assembly protein CpaB
MGKYKSFFLLGTAVVIALITSILIYNSLQKKGPKAAPPLPTQNVAVTTVDLSWGSVLKKEMVKMVPYLKENLPRGSFTDPASVVGRVLVFPMKANEPILESRLAPKDVQTGGVAAVIAPRKRAVAVKVDPVIGVAGFIHAGNRVDVLVTISPEKTGPPVTKTVLENILVLAAGAEVEKKGKDPLQVSVITLEVTPEEGEKLALAATEGKLQMALRSYSDNDDVHTRGTTVPILLASYGGESHSLVKKANTGPRRRSIKRNPAPGKAPVQLTRAKKEEKASFIPVSEIAPPKKAAEEKPVYIIQLIKGSKVSEVKFPMEEEE